MEKIKVFDSGLKLIVKKMSGIYTACCGVFVGVGSSVENTSTNGYSHFIEHLLFKGTKKRSALEISEEIDNVGGAAQRIHFKGRYLFLYENHVRAY